MAQINSSPGKNEALGNVTVSSASAEVGSTSSTKLTATLNTVAYAQNEPGKAISPVNIKRS